MSYVNISGAGVFGRRTLGGLGAAPSVSVQQAVSAIEAIDPSTKAQVDLDPSNPDWINQLLTTYVDSFGGAKAFVSSFGANGQTVVSFIGAGSSMLSGKLPLIAGGLAAAGLVVWALSKPKRKRAA